MLSPSALSRPHPIPPSSQNPDPGDHPPPSSGETASSSTHPLTSPSLELPPIRLSPQTPYNPRKRKASGSPRLDTRPPVTPRLTEASSTLSIPSLLTEDSGGRKKGRTNTPWTATEEQRLKIMRDEGKSWSEIAKAFPARTEGSVKKHWYKDMHYAEFAKDEEAALLEAIKEYDANKWKVIGQKLGKPAKACEQFAKEHFKNY